MADIIDEATKQSELPAEQAGPVVEPPSVGPPPVPPPQEVTTTTPPPNPITGTAPPQAANDTLIVPPASSAGPSGGSPPPPPPPTVPPASQSPLQSSTENKPVPLRKKKGGAGPLVAALLLLLVTLPLSVYFVSQQRELADVRSRAGFEDEPQEVQNLFRAVWGSNAEAQWQAERNAYESAPEPQREQIDREHRERGGGGQAYVELMNSQGVYDLHPNCVTNPDAASCGGSGDGSSGGGDTKKLIETKTAGTVSSGGGLQNCIGIAASMGETHCDDSNATSAGCAAERECMVRNSGFLTNLAIPECQTIQSQADINRCVEANNKLGFTVNICTGEQVQSGARMGEFLNCGQGSTGGCGQVDVLDSSGNLVGFIMDKTNCGGGGGGGEEKTTNGKSKPTPTMRPGPQCSRIRVYKDGAQVTDLSTLKAGDTIQIGVAGTNATKGRIRVNGGAWDQTTKKNSSNEYVIDFTIPPGTVDFTIEAEVYGNRQWQ